MGYMSYMGGRTGCYGCIRLTEDGSPYLRVRRGFPGGGTPFPKTRYIATFALFLRKSQKNPLQTRYILADDYAPFRIDYVHCDINVKAEGIREFNYVHELCT